MKLPTIPHPLIGISGHRRSGKDTIADLLIQLQGIGRKLSFAEELKHEVAIGLGISLSVLEVDKEKYRPLLQVWGDCRRAEDPDYWIKKVIEYRTGFIPEWTPIVMSDVRHLNEAKWIKDSGGVLIRVNRDRKIDPKVDKHISETALDDYKEFDIIIDNNQTLEQLETHVTLCIHPQVRQLLRNRNTESSSKDTPELEKHTVH